MKRKFIAIILIVMTVALFAITPLAFAQDGVQITVTPTDKPTKQNKVALRLAELFDVRYDEIMNWRAQGFGFGSIRIAYTIQSNAEDPGLAVSTVFTLHEGGMGWGEIARKYNSELKLNPGNPWGDSKPGNKNPSGLENKPDKGDKGNKP